MPVPKRKTSKARRNNRNANKNVTASSFYDCKNCNEVALPHQVCKNCGFYKGKKVIVTKLDRALSRGETRNAKVAAAKANAPVEAKVAEPVVEAAPAKKKAAPKKEKKETKE